MKRSLYLSASAVLLSVLELGVGATCNADNCLRALKASPSVASEFCTPYLALTATATIGLPKFLANCHSSPSRISSACSCLVATSPTHSSSTTAYPASCQCTASSIVTQSSCTSTTIVTVSASTITVSAPPVSASTTTITVSAATVTLPAPPASISTTTITSCLTPSPVVIDQSGCPAIDGDSITGYTIFCQADAGPGSIAALATNPGYNIQDCALQCQDRADDVDCLGTTYTAPATVLSPVIDALLPGTCTFYEYVAGVSYDVSGTIDLAVTFD